jgi:hypothetical protein
VLRQSLLLVNRCVLVVVACFVVIACSSSSLARHHPAHLRHPGFVVMPRLFVIPAKAGIQCRQKRRSVRHMLAHAK